MSPPCINAAVGIFFWKQNDEQSVFVLLRYFYFDMDVMVSKAVATDSGDSLSCQMNSLVCLDACRNLKTRMIQSLITLNAFEFLFAVKEENLRMYTSPYR